MLTRKWWIELPFMSPTFNFKWQPVSFGIKFNSLNSVPGLIQMINHFEFHSQLSHKSSLYLNLQAFSEVRFCWLKRISNSNQKKMYLTMSRSHSLSSSHRLLRFRRLYTVLQPYTRFLKALEQRSQSSTVSHYQCVRLSHCRNRVRWKNLRTPCLQ